MFGAPYPTRPSQRSRHLASQWRRLTPRSVRHSNPSHTTTCSSAVCDTRHRRAGAAPDFAPSPTAVLAVASPHRHLRASLPRCAVLDLRCSRPGRDVAVFNQRHPRTPPTPEHPLPHAPTARQDPQSPHRIRVAVHATMPHAPLPLPSVLRVPPHTHGFSLFHVGLRTLLPLPVIVSPLAWRLSFLLQGSHPFLGRPFFLSTCFALRRAPRRPHARTPSSSRTDDRRTNDATCGPQAWLTGKLH